MTGGNQSVKDVPDEDARDGGGGLFVVGDVDGVGAIPPVVVDGDGVGAIPPVVIDGDGVGAGIVGVVKIKTQNPVVPSIHCDVIKLQSSST